MKTESSLCSRSFLRNLILITARCLTAIAAVGVLTVVRATPGDVDVNFSGGGRTSSPFSVPVGSSIVLVQPDGKIIVAGGGVTFSTTLRGFVLARYYPNGEIDRSFGNNGTVVTVMSGLPTGDRIVDATLLADGRIVVAGRVAVSYGPPYDGSAFGVARYLSNGTLDTSFNGTGKALFGGGHHLPSSMEVQPDGKILVAGSTTCVKCSTLPKKFTIVRWNTDGSLDTTFGYDGVVSDLYRSVGDSYADYLALQNDSKIIVAGYSNADLAIARYSPSGALDGRFGNNGMVIIPSAIFYSSHYGLITQPDGKILVAGTTNSTGRLSLYRFLPNGQPDNSFGAGGNVVSSFAFSPNRLLYQPDGKIVVTGRSAIARYLPDGSIDTSFGDRGISLNSDSQMSSSVLQPDGKILTVNGSFNMVRYLGDGPYAQPSAAFDFTADGWTDFAVTRNVDGALFWYVARNPSLQYTELHFGVGTDTVVPADYDGDNKIDFAVYRQGIWFLMRSSDNTFVAPQFGADGDVPVPADYSGDGRAELAVYRSGTWYTVDLATGEFRATQFGVASDRPVPADYDGDGRSDLAVYREGVWYSLQSTEGYNQISFGISGDKTVVGDYDGDGKADPAVFRSGEWYMLGSSQGFSYAQFGLSTDVPVAADYDGDRKADIAVFRDGTWYWTGSSNNQFHALNFGQAGDKPIPASYVR